MTKRQFYTKFYELLKANDRLIKEKADEILKSGVVALASYDDDYRLPKIVMTACCRSIVHQWLSLSTEDQKTFQKLVHP